MIMLSEFSSKDVVRITGVSYRQLDHWDHTGFIKPSINGASGKGSVRLYSFKDLLNIKIAKNLRDAGASIKKIMKSMQFMNECMSKKDIDLSDSIFITDGKGIFVMTEDPKIIVDTLKEGQLCWNLSIKKVKQNVTESILAYVNDNTEKLKISATQT